MLCKPLKVAQQQGFVAGLLPDNADSQFSSKPFRLNAALRVAFDLVRIHQDRSAHEVGTPYSAARYHLIGSSQARKRITGARAEIDDFEMNGELKRL